MGIERLASPEPPSFETGGVGGAVRNSFPSSNRQGIKPWRSQDLKTRRNCARACTHLSITSHSGPMEKKPVPWTRIALLVAELCLAVAAVVFPLVFTQAVVVDFLKLLEVIARAS